jgi:hypothetical protein
MYLTKDTTAATLRQLTGLAPGSTLAMTYLLPNDGQALYKRSHPARLAAQ